MVMLVLAVMACMARAAGSGARVSEIAMRRANNARAAAKIRHLRRPSWYDAASCQWISCRRPAPGILNLDPAVAAHALLANPPKRRHKTRTEEASPHPQPSPPGRGSPVAAVEGASPLPGGEGQGEGRFAQFDTPPQAGNSALAAFCPGVQPYRLFREAMPLATALSMPP